jgi:hypothetical protein
LTGRPPVTLVLKPECSPSANWQNSALAERNLQLALAGNVGRVGSYAYDVSAEKLQVSEGYAALHGLPEGTIETTLSEWRARVHPEDLGRAEGGVYVRTSTSSQLRGSLVRHTLTAYSLSM